MSFEINKEHIGPGIITYNKSRFQKKKKFQSIERQFATRLQLFAICLYLTQSAKSSETMKNDHPKIMTEESSQIYQSRKYSDRNEALTNKPHTMNLHQIEKMAHGFTEEGMVIPVKVDHEYGNPVNHGWHFRSRRSPTDAKSSTNDNMRTKNLHEDEFANFSFSAFGKEFRLNLTPYSSFIAPVFTLQFFGNLTEIPITDYEDTPRHCFYAGNVNSNMKQTTVLSTCGGLFGAFHADDMEYLIQPHTIKTSYSSSDDHDECGAKLHRIFRRSKVKVDERLNEFCPHAGRIYPTNNNNRKTMETVRTSDQTSESYTKSAKETNSLSENITSDIVKLRKKRYMSYPRNVELLVVADNKMYQVHGSNLQHYILTLIAIVHHVFRDPSVENLINIVLVKLEVITDDGVEHGPNVTKNAHECLRNFCRWQADRNNDDESHPSHHDSAVLLTREDLCRSETACDTLGLAELGTMCDPLRSCSINEDNGLSTAFTIIHEIGHEFNAPHDNNAKCADSYGEPSSLHVMSPVLDHKSRPWSWSHCSARYISNFFEYGNGECLLDDPPYRVLPLPSEKPGQIYDVNQQCSFVYGKGVNHCGFMTTCVRLWCVSEDRRHGCRTPHMPWADGTKCAPGKWCQRGKCVAEDRYQQPVDGNWGEWSTYGECSRTCGGGVRMGQRLCNNPRPHNNGRYCTGKRKKYRSCNWQKCNDEKSDFRREQCNSYSLPNHGTYEIYGISPSATWIPKYDGILLQDRCKLICQIQQEDQYGAPWYVFKPRVINGTPCGIGTHDICVDGICKRAGCDHVLNSNSKVDACGVCGGDGSSCKTLKGVYNIGKMEGFANVVEIPAGSTNIIIEQGSPLIAKEDENYLVLKDGSGRFILNGNQSVIQFEHTIFKPSANGSGYAYYFDYSGSSHPVERLNSSSVIQENITVLVLSTGDLSPPDIRYQYNVPFTEQVSYSWNPYGPWIECSHPCQGQTKRKAVCMRNGDQQVVANNKCRHQRKPPFIRRSCNTHCTIKWRLKTSECSSHCGKGTETLTYECVKITRFPAYENSTTVQLRGDQCNSLLQRTVRSCQGKCLDTGWKFGHWTQCTHTCGGGTQMRSARCRNPGGRILPMTQCDSKTRLSSRMCNQFPCPQWVSSDFSECLATCGFGVHRRRVWCRAASGDVLDDPSCSNANKPDQTAQCQLPACPKWKYNSWGTCSVTCEEGITMREVHCVDFKENQVDDDQCNVALRKKDIKTCRISTSCSGDIENGERMRIRMPAGDDSQTANGVDIHWRLGQWTSCSAPCGIGIRMRQIKCQSNISNESGDNHCDRVKVRPANMETCIVQFCQGSWQTGNWSECSVSCGSGIKKRYIHCVNNGSYVHDSQCEMKQKPPSRTQCSSGVSCSNLRRSYVTLSNIEGSINTWKSGPWSECSSSCGNGNQKRAVFCIGNCNAILKPLMIKLCDSGPCPRWRSGSWSTCSVSCGGGLQFRQVKCIAEQGPIINDTSCDIMARPPDSNLCGTDICPGQYYSWRSNRWSKCSVTCGRGMKQRTVKCVYKQSQPYPDGFCSSLSRKPVSTRKCRTGRRCPRWQAGTWSKCSTSCGPGKRKRRVNCRYKRKSINPESCNNGHKPADVEHCNGTTCNTARWLIKRWRPCSVTCGMGVSHRSVSCADAHGKEVPEFECLEDSPKPRMNGPCIQRACQSYWHVQSWSMCSTTCGPGIEIRDVKCMYLEKPHSEPSQAFNCEQSKKPPSSRNCTMNSCQSRTHWRVGPWNECSASCGDGMSIRLVVCYDRNYGRRIAETECDPHKKPESQRRCTQKACMPTTCRYAQTQLQTRIDGHYYLTIQGSIVKVYCKQMNTYNPTEYITLPAEEGENFSEIYGMSLNRADSCPNNGTRDDHCDCTKNAFSGKTIFTKIRINVVSMEVIVDDFSFARNVYGRSIEYGVAGDCYSRMNCPQGRFGINLSGTGLAVSRETNWHSYGRHIFQRILRNENGTHIQGMCGGKCSQCRPDPLHGLILTNLSEK